MLFSDKALIFTNLPPQSARWSMDQNQQGRFQKYAACNFLAQLDTELVKWIDAEQRQHWRRCDARKKQSMRQPPTA
jgi:hypothetical protein